ncbi:MAG TPA: ERF family protein [Chloroflexia bacterium]|nr:ERF family protein [Chloroflexia bacterium]
MADETLHTKLATIQATIKAPKGQWNDYSKYNYRNCEDILEAIKPHLNGLTLILSDEMIQLGDRYYVKATAKLSDGKDTIENTAFAREALVKKGMDESQITGAASSYARKYALSGLLALDDTKDADTMDNRDSKPAPTQEKGKPADDGYTHEPVDEPHTPTRSCTAHGEPIPMKQAISPKSHKPYWSHKDQVTGKICFGSGYLD